MFVELLDTHEKVALMSLLVKISKADGEIAQEEINFLNSYAAENDIELDMNNEASISELCGQIQSMKGKVVTIQELVKLAIADGHYDPAERKGAIYISNELGLASEKFESIEQWVLDGQAWVARGVELLN